MEQVIRRRVRQTRRSTSRDLLEAEDRVLDMVVHLLEAGRNHGAAPGGIRGAGSRGKRREQS